MADYSKYQKKASQKLGKYSDGSFVYTSPDVGGDTPYDPVTPGSDYTINGGIGPDYHASMYNDRLSSATTLVIFPHIDPVTGSAIAFEPVEAGTMTIDGVKREIVAVDRSLGAGTTIVWKVYVKG